MDKLKAGDRVRILPRKPGQELQWPGYIDDMARDAGEEDTVVQVISIRLGRDFINLDKHGRWWHEDWLELIPEVLTCKEDLEALYA